LSWMDSTAQQTHPHPKNLPAVRAGMYCRFIALPWLHVLFSRSIEAGPWNIVEGPAAAKGAVPPEGWGRECEGGTTEHEGTSPYHASGWQAFCFALASVYWPAKSMTAAQPRVASRAAPHGGGPAYLPRLKGAE
jgi:hypothetical protein